MNQQNPLKQIQQDQQSQWSLSSLQQLKGLNLNQLKQQEDIQQQKIKQKQPNSQKQHKNKLQPKYPPFQQININTKIYQVGKILQKVGQLIIVQANNYINLVDLDNWLFDCNKKCFGFVIDIFGKIQNPYYAIKMLEEYEKTNIGDLNKFIGMQLYYAEGCKTLTQQDIRSIKQKSSINKQADQQNDSSSQSQNQDYDEECRSNTMMKQKQLPSKRRASFQQQPYNRDRTRQKRNYRKFQNNYNDRNDRNDRKRHFDARQQQFQPRNQNRDRQHNQMYLQNMYNMYYNQMMQLYNGQNGMPLPKPPVFPMFQQPPLQQAPLQQMNQPGLFGTPQQVQMPPPPSNYPIFPPFPPNFDDSYKGQ